MCFFGALTLPRYTGPQEIVSRDGFVDSLMMLGLQWVRWLMQVTIVIMMTSTVLTITLTITMTFTLSNANSC